MTKYDRSDPSYVEDWTSISDVGKAFRGNVLTLERYLEVEARHLRVVASFLAEVEAESMTARSVESWSTRCWPQEGESLGPVETVDVVRDMLRERGFCRLDAARNVYLHVGYDYYLYLGGTSGAT